MTVNCSGLSCSASLSNPPWGSWLRVVVDSSRVNQTVTFTVLSNLTGERRKRADHLTCPLCSLWWASPLCTSVGCKPESVGLKADGDLARLRGSSSNSSAAGNGSLDSDALVFNEPVVLPAPTCVQSVPVLYEEMDVLSLRFTPVSGPNVSVTYTNPTLLTYPLHTYASGGTLNLQLTLNSVSIAECSGAETHRRLSWCLSRLFSLIDQRNHREQQRHRLFYSLGAGPWTQPLSALSHRYCSRKTPGWMWKWSSVLMSFLRETV